MAVVRKIRSCQTTGEEWPRPGRSTLKRTFSVSLQVRGGSACGACPVAKRKSGTDPDAPTGYTYNDDDGTTAWDVEEAIQVSGFDSNFHDASLFVQPLPFAHLEANYPQLNGRGYPDTLVEGDLPAPVDDADGKVTGTPGELLNNGTPTQTMDSVINLIPLVSWVITGDEGLIVVPVKVNGQLSTPKIELQAIDTLSKPVGGILLRTLKLPVELLTAPKKLLPGVQEDAPDARSSSPRSP